MRVSTTKRRPFRKLQTGATLLLGLLLVVVSAPQLVAQARLQNRAFLRLDDPEPYLNYGRTMFDPYPDVLSSRNQYDRLGNFLMRGYNIVRFDEVRPGLSDMERETRFVEWFNNLIITNDSYRGVNYSLSVGDVIRTKFTDMTMKHPRWDGVRLDGATSDNRFTLMFSRGERTTQTTRFSTFGTSAERSSVIAFGGHWQTRLGDILQLGTTYYNQHMSDNANADNSFLRGDTPYSMLPPSFITLAFEDDSPDRGDAGATIYRVDMFIVGESMGEEVRFATVQGVEGYAYRPELKDFPPIPASGHQVAGNARRLYQFSMPEYVLPSDEDYAANPEVQLQGVTIKSVRFQAEVEGDYRIGLRQKHLFFDEDEHLNNLKKGYSPNAEGERERERYVNPFTGLKGGDWLDDEDDDDEARLTPAEAEAAGFDVFRTWPVMPNPSANEGQLYKWDVNPDDIFYTVVRSSGRSRPRGVVEFAYGVPTGQALYGLDMKLTLRDLTVKGELVVNPQNFIFPMGRNAGKRHSKRAWSYYLTVDKKLGSSLELGGEIFNLDADFSGNYDAERGGIPFFTDRARSDGNVSVMEEFRVMADNDDNDQFPDESLRERPSGNLTDAGIFPGLDENGDLVPDSDQNFNGAPDWTEPLLFYDADPPEFVYGIDLNNNGVVDFRENDDEPDYPYRRDRKGVHLFAVRDELGLLGKWISAGAYRTREPVGGNEANAFYLRHEYYRASPFFGTIRINDDIKWVRDEIRDDVYVWQDYLFDDEVIINGETYRRRDLNSQLFAPPPDPLLMKNSFVTTLFAESNFNQIADLNIVNNVQYIRNSQKADEFDDGTSQEEDVRTRWTLVNKVDYTIRLGDSFRIKPMFKHLLFRETSKNYQREFDDPIRSTSIYTPILRVEHQLTPKSFFQMGYQGLPFWKYRFKDRVDSSKDFKEWNLVIMMTNRSDYWGYSVANSFGYQRTSREFDDELVGEGLDRHNSRLFFDIMAGY